MTINFIGSVSAATTANGTTPASITLPSSISAGDVLVALVAVTTPTTTDAPITSAPSGWTHHTGVWDVGSGTGGGIRLELYSRVASGSEDGSSVSWGSTAVNGHIAVTVLQYSGTDGVVSGNYATWAQTATSTQPGWTAYGSGTLTISADHQRLVSAWADPRGSGQTWNLPDTQRAVFETSNTNIAVADTNGPAAQGAYTRTANVGTGSAAAVGILFALQATTTGPSPITAASTQTLGKAFLQCTSTPQNGGSMTYSISPSSGLTSLGNGQWLAPIPASGAAAVTYTMTATETYTGGTQTATSSQTIQPATPATTPGTTFVTKIRKNGAWT